MSMKAMYLIEAKTRLTQVRKEIDALMEMVSKMDSARSARFAPQIEELQMRYSQLQGDLDLLQQVDEAEWGEFSTDLDEALHHLAHDVNMLKTEMEQEGAPA